jgi:uncharacterized integral membrane protein
MLQMILILALVVSILAVVFALQNAMPVVVNMLVWQVEIDLALLLLITFTSGVLTSQMVSIPTMLLRWRRKRRKAQVAGDTNKTRVGEILPGQAESGDKGMGQEAGDSGTEG